MTSAAPAAAPTARDNRYKMLDATIRRHRHEPDSLLEVLHTAQELFGFLSTEILWHIVGALHVPPSRVYGVVTFYSFFSLEPKGAHTCVVCLGTACYVKGSAAVLGAIEAAHGIRSGQTTADGTLSLATARCLGACGIAPAVVFDNQVVGSVGVEGALERLRTWIPG